MDRDTFSFALALCILDNATGFLAKCGCRKNEQERDDVLDGIRLKNTQIQDMRSINGEKRGQFM